MCEIHGSHEIVCPADTPAGLNTERTAARRRRGYNTDQRYRMSSRGFGAMIGVGLLAALAVSAQVALTSRPKPLPSDAVKLPPSTLRVDSNLVLVPVTVCDPNNRPVTGLEKEHFKIFDDKIEQNVTHFAMDDEPVAVGLVFDISGSMAQKLQKSRVAAAAFFKTANPDDEFFLVEFNDQPKLEVPLTRDVEDIQN